MPKMLGVKNLKQGKTASKQVPTPSSKTIEYANSAPVLKSATSKSSAGATVLVRDRCPVTCGVGAQNVVDGKDQALYCEGLCISWIHRYGAGVSVTHFEALSASSDPFLCAGCFQKICEKELVDLRSAVQVLREKIAQLRKALDEKDPVILDSEQHFVRCQGSVRYLELG